MDLIEFSFPFSFLFSLTFFSISRLTLQARFLDLSVLYQEKEKRENRNGQHQTRLENHSKIAKRNTKKTKKFWTLYVLLDYKIKYNEKANPNPTQFLFCSLSALMKSEESHNGKEIKRNTLIFKLVPHRLHWVVVP